MYKTVFHCNWNLETLFLKTEKPWSCQSIINQWSEIVHVESVTVNKFIVALNFIYKWLAYKKSDCGVCNLQCKFVSDIVSFIKATVRRRVSVILSRVGLPGRRFFLLIVSFFFSPPEGRPRRIKKAATEPRTIITRLVIRTLTSSASFSSKSLFKLTLYRVSRMYRARACDCTQLKSKHLDAKGSTKIATLYIQWFNALGY